MGSSPEPVLVRAHNPGMMTLEGTNTWMIPVPGGSVVIDPGPADAGHVATLAEHGDILAVLLTHGHADHSGALGLLRPDVPVYAASARFTGGLAPVQEGQLIRVGDLALRALHTPGHTSDSLCFVYDDAAEGPVLFTGDTLLGGPQATSLAVVDGALRSYLASLDRLIALPRCRGMPGHGPVIADVSAHASSADAHRRGRLRELAAALAEGADPDPEAIVLARYPESPHRRARAADMRRAELDYLGLPHP